MANEMRKLMDFEADFNENKIQNDGSDLEFSDLEAESMLNHFEYDGMDNFSMRDDFSADLDDIPDEFSVDFSDSLSNYSLH